MKLFAGRIASRAGAQVWRLFGPAKGAARLRPYRTRFVARLREFGGPGRFHAVVLIWLAGWSAAAAPDLEVLSLEGAGGVTVLRDFSGAPDAAGVVKTYEVRPGGFGVACYWAPYQKYDRASGPWYNAVNRLQPLAVHKPSEMKQGGLAVLFQLDGGDYLCVLALSGDKTVGWLEGREDRLLLQVGNLGTARVEGVVPVAAWCRDADPYAACRGAWHRALESDPIRSHLKWRSEKTLPDFVHYLGFGTFEEYRGNYDAANLVGMIHDLNASGTPVRWIQIGIGHHDTKPLGEHQRLNSFEPTPKKFPEGWKPVMSALTPGGVTWLGLFQTMNGVSANGIHPQNALGELNRHLREVPGHQLLPRNTPEDAAAFYDAMLGAVHAHGFTFIKMDFQTSNTLALIGTDDPVGSAVKNMRAYEDAAAHELQGTINCMAHNPVCLFNTGESVITRVSQDYKKGDLGAAVRQISNCYGNLPMIGQTCWGDFDMFHSSDAVSGAIMAVAKAVSGGTIYLSDKVSEISKERVLPLCYRDGRTLRPLAPPAPLPESLFMDPFKSGRAYRGIAPLAHHTAAVVAYNLSEPARPVRGSISAADYRHATAMVQPYPGPWTIPSAGLVLYDWRTGRAEKLAGVKEYTLRDFNEDRLFLLCPIEDGWAIIGRTDKYLAPAAVEVVSRSAKEMVLKMVESGPLAVWSSGEAKADGYRSEFANGLLRVDVPARKSGELVRITR